MTTQVVGILLVILSSVAAYLVSLRLDRRRPVQNVARRKPGLSRRRRLPPLHY